jgi:hypothetical protein
MFEILFYMDKMGIISYTTSLLLKFYYFSRNVCLLERKIKCFYGIQVFYWMMI